MDKTKEVSPLKVIVNGKYAFKQGDLFKSYEEVRQRMDDHSKESFVYYWLRDSRTVEGAFKKASRPIQKRLKYYSVKYACIFGGQRFCSRGNGRRNLQTIRNNCPAYVLLRASKCGNYLEVITVCNEHNHEVSEDSSKSLSQNRKPSPEIRDEIQQMLLLKIDRNTIIEYVRLKYQKNLTKKDLFNLGARTKRLYADCPVDENLAKVMKEHMDDFIRGHESESSDQDEFANQPSKMVEASKLSKSDVNETVTEEDGVMYYEDSQNKEAGVYLIEYLSDEGETENHEEIEKNVTSPTDNFCETGSLLEQPEQYSEPSSPVHETIVLEVYNPNEITNNELISNDLTDTQALIAVLGDSADDVIEENVEETSDSGRFVLEEVEVLSDIHLVEKVTDDVSDGPMECDKCGQDLTLLQKRVRCMEKYYRKLEEETRTLELKRNNLKREISHRMKQLFNF